MRTCGLIKGNCAPNQHRVARLEQRSAALIAPGYFEIGGHSYRATATTTTTTTTTIAMARRPWALAQSEL
jgi:hypothetical protein